MITHRHFITVAEFLDDPARALQLAEEEPLAVIGADGSLRMTLSSPLIGPTYNGFKAPFEDEIT